MMTSQILINTRDFVFIPFGKTVVMQWLIFYLIKVVQVIVFGLIGLSIAAPQFPNIGLLFGELFEEGLEGGNGRHNPDHSNGT